MQNFLDKTGLSYFWDKVKSYVNSKVEIDDTLTKNEDGVMGVTTPTVHLTKTEWEALSEEEKQKNILRIVDEPPWMPMAVSVQDYTTDNGWHVRKYSDGYVEMFYSFLWNETFATTTAGLLRSLHEQLTYPFQLIELYALNIYAGSGRTGGTVWIGTGSNEMEDRLKKTPKLYAVATDNNWTEFEVHITVTGRWK